MSAKMASNEVIGGGATQPLPRDGGVAELPWRPNSQATPQGLDQSSKIKEVVPKMACWRASMTIRCYAFGASYLKKIFEIESVSKDPKK